LVARLLWEQDVAGSNPVTPTAKPVSPALTSQPPTQGGFFIACRVVVVNVRKALIAKADHVDLDRTDRLASKAERYGIKAIRLLAQSTRYGVEQKQRGRR
jgi:hypothetical protein